MAGVGDTALLHPGMSEGVISEVQLHSMPVVNLSTVSNIEIEKPTVNAIDELGQQFEIYFPPSDKYIDLREAQLYIEYMIKGTDGNQIKEADVASPVCNFFHALFESVQMQINNAKVTSNMEDYNYKAYIQALLNTSKGWKENFLSSTSMFVLDKATKFDVLTNDNTGFAARRKEAAVAGYKTLTGRLALDMADQGKYLPKNTGIRFVFTRSKPSFYMLQTAGLGFQAYLKNARMTLRGVEVTPQVAKQNVINLEKLGPYNFDINRRKISQYTLNPGSGEYKVNSTDGIQIPERMIIGLVDKKAASGNDALNPYNFKAFDLTEFNLIVNDRKITYEGDFKGGDVTGAFHKFFVETGLYTLEKDVGINRDLYKEGCTFFAFDLSPDRAIEDIHRKNLIKSGNLQFHLKFKTDLTSSVAMIVFSQYDNLVNIDEVGNVTTDYTMS